MTNRNSILIVEDEIDIRESLQEVLERESFFIETVSNGKEALERLKSDPLPRLILLDLLMPGMGGLEFRQRQLENRDIADIPVIILSADHLTEKKAKELRLDFLKKPLELENILQVLRQYCPSPS